MIRLNDTSGCEILIEVVSAKVRDSYTEVEDANGRCYFVKESIDKIEELILRDKFAMSAISGIINSRWSDSLIEDVRMSYDIADQMLKQRKGE